MMMKGVMSSPVLNDGTLVVMTAAGATTVLVTAMGVEEDAACTAVIAAEAPVS